MSPRTGRPKKEVTLDTRIGVRLDAETVKKLDEVAEMRNESRSVIIRRGIEHEYKEAIRNKK